MGFKKSVVCCCCSVAVCRSAWRRYVQSRLYSISTCSLVYRSASINSCPALSVSLVNENLNRNKMCTDKKTEKSENLNSQMVKIREQPEST